MHDDNSKNKKLQQFLHIKRSFYSLCRKDKGINLDNSDNANIIIENLKEKYNELNINDYILLLSRLNKMILNKDITTNDALIIAVNVVDPDYKLYALYDEICNYDELKNKILKTFKFYDNEFLDIEKRYVEGNELNKNLSYKNEA